MSFPFTHGLQLFFDISLIIILPHFMKSLLRVLCHDLRFLYSLFVGDELLPRYIVVPTFLSVPGFELLHLRFILPAFMRILFFR